MDVIADNVANVNTVGFKSSRVTFNEVFSQLVSGAAAPNPATGRGGVNAMQIGLGVGIASIDKIMTPGFAQRTDRALDLMLDGSGFFIVGDGSGIYFTRAGAFDVDPLGNIVDPRGMILMGWDIDASGNIVRSAVQPLNIHDGGKQNMPANATTVVNFSGNLNGQTNPIHPSTISVTDSLGGRWILDVEFHMGAATTTGTPPVTTTEWHVRFPANGNTGAGQTANGVYMFAEGNPEQFVRLGDFAAANQFTLTFDSNGNPVGTTSHLLGFANPLGTIAPGATLGRPPATGETPVMPGGGTATSVVQINFGELLQTQAGTSVRRNDNGNPPGTLAEFTVGPDGIITGRYSNGLQRTLGQVAVARFPNPGGLQKIGNNLFVPTSNSGEFDGTGEEVGTDGSSIMGGVLEMSNVDLAGEFTNIIVTQRGFQANSRIISTSDEMLQELVNLRR